MVLDASYEGELYLSFSLYSPEHDSSSTPFSSLAEEVEYWLVKEFLCGSDDITRLRLVQDFQLTNTCTDESYFRQDNLRKRQRRLALPPDMLVLWNEPTSNISERYLERKDSQESLHYTFWNVSYPVFDWGLTNKNPRMVQRDVQHLLEQKIWEKELEFPMQGSGVSVEGDEDQFWKLFVPPVSPSINQPSEEEITQLLPRTRQIDPEEARYLMYIGALMVVVQTILMMLLHQHNKRFRAMQKKNGSLMDRMDRENLDELLESSKGFVEMERRLHTVESSDALERSEPMVTKTANGEWYIVTSPSTSEKKSKKKEGRRSYQKLQETDSTTAPSSSLSSSSTKAKERHSASSIDKAGRISHHKNHNGNDEKQHRSSSQQMSQSNSTPSWQKGKA